MSAPYHNIETGADDFRMAQMFGSRADFVPVVLDVFNRMVTLIPNPEQPQRADRGPIRLVYGINIRQAPHNGGQIKVCGPQNNADALYFAVTVNKENTNDLQEKYNLEEDMIIFCPGFFMIEPVNEEDIDKYRGLNDDRKVINKQRYLDKMRTPGI